MLQSRWRALGALLPALLLLAGCGDGKNAKPKVTYKYDYGNSNEPVDFAALVKQFLDDPPAAKTRKVPPEKTGLTFLGMDGKAVELASFKGKSNVVLVVTKGLPQSPGGVFCPGCLAQTNALAANIAEFKKRDAEVLIVFPGPSAKAGEFLTTAKVTDGGKPALALLLDADMKAVAVLNIEGDRAKPSTYILNRAGEVVYAYVGEHVTDRPSVKALLGQLDKLNAQK